MNQPADPHPKRILTVCLGNYCRSPAAAAVLAAKGAGKVEIGSAGTRSEWKKQPAHPLMIEAAAARGYDLTAHRGVQVSSAMLEWADVVLAMDLSNLAELCEIATFHTLPKLQRYLATEDVPDPWGHPPAAFHRCLSIIEAGAERHLP